MTSRSHRELVFDEFWSPRGRGVKHVTRATTSGYRVEEAYDMGQATILGEWPVPRRWRTNPFPPGTRRHKAYDDGVESAREQQAETRRTRRYS